MYDRETGDRVDQAYNLKPDITGVNNVKASKHPPPKPGNATKAEDFVCYWSLLTTRSTSTRPDRFQIEMPVEVKGDWRLMIRQLGSYCRAQFSAFPLRAATVGIAVDHTKYCLRFVIFHRGGLTATSVLNLTSTKDRKEIQELMLAILLWQSPRDACLPSFTDGRRFRFPIPAFCEYEISQVLYRSLSIRGRSTYVTLLKKIASSVSPQVNQDMPVVLAPKYNLRAIRGISESRHPFFLFK